MCWKREVENDMVDEVGDLKGAAVGEEGFDDSLVSADFQQGVDEHHEFGQAQRVQRSSDHVVPCQRRQAITTAHVVQRRHHHATTRRR